MSAKLSEIFGSLGDYIIVELEHNTACVFAVDCDVELERMVDEPVKHGRTTKLQYTHNNSLSWWILLRDVEWEWR